MKFLAHQKGVGHRYLHLISLNWVWLIFISKVSYLYFDIFYLDFTINLTSSDHSVPLSNKVDLTSCIWPRYSFYSNQCNFPLLDFILNSEINMNVGTIYSEIIELSPFSSTQNAKFLLKVFDENNLTPGWIQINNNNMTVSILKSKVKFTGRFQINFVAQLITTQYPDDNYTDYTTIVKYSFFTFENSNWKLSSIKSKDYYLLNRLQDFPYAP